MKYLPNILSLTRGLIGIAVTSGLVPTTYFISAFCWATASDFLDGFLSRRFGWTSAMGAGIDIAADGVFFFGAYWGLWRSGLLPGMWLLLILALTLPELVCQGILWARGCGIGSLGSVMNKVLGGYCYFFAIAVALGAGVAVVACVHLVIQAFSNGTDLYVVLRRRERMRCK